MAGKWRRKGPLPVSQFVDRARVDPDLFRHLELKKPEIEPVLADMVTNRN
jgi:hypothetical protein